MGELATWDIAVVALSVLTAAALAIRRWRPGSAARGCGACPAAPSTAAQKLPGPKVH